MPLDSNLFVLLVRPRGASDPGWIDFVIDGSSDGALYSAHKDAAGPVYSLYDPVTATLYGTLFQPPPSLPNATQPNPKLRSIVLESPRVDTKLNNVGRLNWEWEFEWQETTYVWTRDVVGLFGNERGFTLSVSRRPDPNYPVVNYHPRKKGGSIEILDYNFARVEPAIEDKKGMEITFLLSLCFFLDPLFAVAPSGSIAPAVPARRTAQLEIQAPSNPTPSAGGNVSKRALATNEIIIETDSDRAMDAYCSQCLALFEDRSLVYLLLMTPTSRPDLSASLVKLAERVKRKRYKVSGEEIKLFVDDSEDQDAVDVDDGEMRDTRQSASKKAGVPQKSQTPKATCELETQIEN
ncbi:hypothetical protein JCM3766R1_005589 [Sporobolomyces carnicolor]